MIAVGLTTRPRLEDPGGAALGAARRHRLRYHHDDSEHEHLPLLKGGVSKGVEGLEKFTLHSVGIDIGSSTSHVIFSRLVLRREGAGYSARFRVASRRVLYESPILLTPYVSPSLLDVEGLRKFIDASYAAARLTPATVQTGAVVLTGEALKKENAKPIAEMMAAGAGKFICVSAGPHHEAVLAAHGSGAVQSSRTKDIRVLNVDIGGGTTKLSLVSCGEITEIAAVNLGARLIAWDRGGRVTRIEDAGRLLAKLVGWDVQMGQQVTASRVESTAALMASLLLEVLQKRQDLSQTASELMLTDPLHASIEDVQELCFSGGVSEYIYGRDSADYGDLGPNFAVKLREGLAATGFLRRVRKAKGGIRATVIGAAEYTVQASGSTSYISDVRVLPLYGLKLIKVDLRNAQDPSKVIRRQLASFDCEQFGPGLALAVGLPEAIDYPLMRRIADGIADVLKDDATGSPVVLTLEADVAKSLGRILKQELGLAREIVCIDGIESQGSLEFVDIGEPLGVTEVVPVTIKSLVFPHN